MGCDLPILAYHKVDSRRELGITSLSPRRFERQIRFLKREGYTSISPYWIQDAGCWKGIRDQSIGVRDQSIEIRDQLIGIRDQGKPLFPGDYSLNPPVKPGASSIQCPVSVKPMLITFDDGYEGVYIHAYPILKKYTSTAIIFVTTGYIGKHNNWDASPGPRFKHLDWAHIREMADDGIWFGSHGVNHTFLTKQGDSAARYEIEASKKELEDGLGRPIHFFSYPYGDYDDRIINFVQEAGYEAAFSLRPELLRGVIYNAPTVYALPRIAIYLVDNMWAFKAKIGCVRSGSPSYMQKAKNRLINRCAYASMLVKRLRS